MNLTPFSRARMRITSALAMTLLLAACAGSRWLSDQQFQDYVASLHLAEMSLANASAKLVSEGFMCEPRGEQVSCTRPLHTRYGSESPQVILTASTDSTVKVESSMTIVVM